MADPPMERDEASALRYLVGLYGLTVISADPDNSFVIGRRAGRGDS